jgi:hypothetical protein
MTARPSKYNSEILLKMTFEKLARHITRDDDPPASEEHIRATAVDLEDNYNDDECTWGRRLESEWGGIDAAIMDDLGMFHRFQGEVQAELHKEWVRANDVKPLLEVGHVVQKYGLLVKSYPSGLRLNKPGQWRISKIDYEKGVYIKEPVNGKGIGVTPFEDLELCELEHLIPESPTSSRRAELYLKFHDGGLKRPERIELEALTAIVYDSLRKVAQTG